MSNDRHQVRAKARDTFPNHLGYKDFWDPMVFQTALGQGNQYAGAAPSL